MTEITANFEIRVLRFKKAKAFEGKEKKIIFNQLIQVSRFQS